MSEWALPLLVLAAALGSTYLFCLRPMRNGNCATRNCSPASAGDQRVDRELQEARLELQRVRAEIGVGTAAYPASPAPAARGTAPAFPDVGTSSTAPRPPA